MPERYEYGSLAAANSIRDRAGEHLDERDDRRQRTVLVRDDTPDSIRERLETESLASQKSADKGRGMAELSASERRSLERQHDSYDWQTYGFEAMRSKAALEAKGATEWQDFYEPGEGVAGSLQNLRSRKQQAARGGGASIGVGGDYTDEEEMGGMGRRARQTERIQSQQVESAKGAALVDRDTGAIDFLQETRDFETGDVFDIHFDDTAPPGQVDASGRDYERLQERHEQRSERSQTMDERRHAPVTRDPLEWTQNPDQYDYPGIDTAPTDVPGVGPISSGAGDVNQSSPINRDQGDGLPPGVGGPDPAGAPKGGFDDATPGVGADRKGSQNDDLADNPLMADDRDREGKLFDFGMEADPTQHRESRTDVEQSTGGLLEDTRDSVGRGPDLDAAMAGRQESFGDFPGFDDEENAGPDLSMF